MKLIYFLVILTILQSCSFDNKSGIWKNDSEIIDNKKDKKLKEFKKLSSKDEEFNEIIDKDKNFSFVISDKVANLQWLDKFYNNSNNFDNFQYANLNDSFIKGKKISSSYLNDYILFKNNRIISSDKKGNIIIYSIDENKIVRKFNFYKKNYKNIDKRLNIIINNNVIYVSDNLGFLYAFDFNKNSILWAKNYRIPFRSNIKIFENKLIVANQNNTLFFINKKNGDILKSIPTEETIIKNQFLNNISLSKEFSFFLNNYGSLYAINNKNLNIEWFLNFNQSLKLDQGNLFSGHEIVLSNKKLVLTTGKNIYVLDQKSGSIIYKKNFTSIVKPLIINDYLFIISKKSLLISLNLNNGKIIYSQNINKKLFEFLDKKEKKISFKSIFVSNDDLLIFLKNSSVVSFTIDGKIKEVKKLPSKLNIGPIFIDSRMLYLSSRNKIYIIN